MPSPMDDCNNRMNIDTSPSAELKRKLDGSEDDLLYPCKKTSVSPISIKVNGVAEESLTPSKNETGVQVKLSKAEKEALRMEKAKEREAERVKKEQERLKREEEKRKREEERLKKQAERDELKRKKDAEREMKEREKEEQRRKKEEEQEKKQRSQLRLNDFFFVPAKKSETPPKSFASSLTDYQRYFQPFHIRQNVTLAPVHRFIPEPARLEEVSSRISVALPTQEDDKTIEPSSPIIPREILVELISECGIRILQSRGRSLRYTAKELISFMNEQSATLDPYTLLKRIPKKHLQYAEDVRPAYNGSFTRRTKHLTPRNPFKQDSEVFAYDYDSEAEWEMEPDGENLDDESIGDDEESILEESGDEEDRAFLDDEDDSEQAKSKGKAMGKRFAGPLEPTIKGICWEDGGVQGEEMLSQMKASVLLFDEKGNEISTPINPLSVEYWAVEMPPPPAPKMDGQMLFKKSDGSGIVQFGKGTVKTKAAFPETLLPQFLKAIQGTTHNQVLLVELLKKQFSSITKGVITDKLKEVAFRTGKRDTDHWEIRKDFLALIEG